MDILIVSLPNPDSRLQIFLLIAFYFSSRICTDLQELKFQEKILETTKALILELHPLKAFT